MGLAILKNIADHNNKKYNISAIDPANKPELENVEHYQNISDLPENYEADIIFIAVKPQICREILLEAKNQEKFAKNAIYISIVAGKKISFFKDIFGKNSKVVRTMPNLPIIENKGIFAYYFSKNIKNRDRRNLVELFHSFGQILELDKESKFDKFTAIFGSGPAYIFLLQEILLSQAKNLGLEDEKAHNLVAEFILGSAIMAKNSDLSFSELRQSVTSKAGTTQAGLDQLTKNDALKKLVNKTIKAAEKRSKELSK